MIRIVLFDAVATLIRPHPSVVAVYREVGTRFGSRLSEEQIAVRFVELRSEIFPYSGQSIPVEWDSIHLPSSEATERRLWRELVTALFVDVDDREGVFEELWRRFSRRDAWRLYDDVPSCVRTLKRAGFKLGIASNFDSRLMNLVRGNKVLNSFDHVFVSSYLGVRKPDLQFYRSIHDRLGASCTMVGNHLVHDCLAPRRVGWTAYWLRREGRGNDADSEDDSIDRSGVEVITDLGQLPLRLLSADARPDVT